MILAEEAEKIILQNLYSSPIEVMEFDYSRGRILREPIFADRDLPPYDRSTMDGIAINYKTFEKGNKTFKIEGIAAAGNPQLKLTDPENCIEIMTGAIVPENCDTVVPYEITKIEIDKATVNADKITEGQHIHYKGIDRKQGQVLIEYGKKIGTAEIGILASVGKAKFYVSKMPKVLILSTGKELISIRKVPDQHQIRRSNVYGIRSILEREHIKADIAHINDDKIEIREKLERYIYQYDVIILSGGVSKGKYDFLPEVLEELKVTKLFHKVKQRPGKPFWFGKNENTFVFALPGNPVSSIVCTQYYFLKWLKASLKEKNNKQVYFPLSEDVIFKPDLTYFLPVVLTNNHNQTSAKPVLGNGSGDFANLYHIDGFLKLNSGNEVFKKGNYFEFIPLR